MGKIIKRKVKAMNWKAKIALVLCFTLIFSTFMYEGWYKPRPAHAAVTTYKGSFTKTTSPGTQTISGIPFQPKALIFFWTKNPTSGTSTANGMMGIGFYDGTTNASVATVAQDNVGTTNTGWIASSTYSIYTLNTTPAIAARASVTGFTADGFTLNWPTADAQADIIHYIAIGGTDITNVKVGQFNGPATTGNFSVTTVGFQPDFVMLASTDRTATTLDAVQAAGALNIGMFTSTTWGAIGWGSRDNQTTVTHAHALSDAHAFYGIRRNSADQVATFVSMDATGFTLNFTTAGGNAPYIYIAIKGGQHRIGSFTKRTSAGSQSITGLGFQPTGLMLFSHNSTAGNGTVETANPAAAISIGASSGSAAMGTVWMHDRTIINTDVNMISHTNLVMRMGASNNGITDYGQATLTSYDTGGFTLNWTTSDATARRVLYWAIGSSTPTDTTPPVPGTVTVSPDGNGYTSSSPTITTQFTDNESDVTSCEYTTNGTTWSAGVVSGTSPTWTCTAQPSGLSGNLTINMRATSSGGTGTATAINRTVDATAPTDGTLTATAGDQQVSLSWSGFSDAGIGLDTTDTYKLVYLTTGFPNANCTNGTDITAVTTQTSYVHTGLTNGTTYYYRLCAYDRAGNISTGVTASATPQSVPATTTGTMSFPLVTSNSIQVQVSFSGDGNGNNSCVIKYGTSPGSYPNTAPAPTRGAGTFTTTVTGLSSSTMYYFQATFSDPDGVNGTNPVLGSQATTSDYTNDPLLHNSTNTASGYWSANGGWGIPNGKYGAFVCETCHTPRATNIKGIKSTITTPDGSNWATSGTPSVTVNFQSYTTSATAMGNDTETRTSSTRICEVCHSQTAYHKYSQPSGGSAHNGVSDCTTCHKHNQGFAGDGPCMSCHNAALNVLYNTRQVVGTGGDFVKASHHVNNGSTTEIVTNYDCAVCHAEADADKIAAGTGWIDKTKHKNGTTNTGDPATDRMVKLRNVDNYTQSYNFSKHVLTKGVASQAQKTAMRDDLDRFCMGCHDADGASTIAVNNTNNGLFLGATQTNTTRSGTTQPARLRPFNTNDNLRGNTADATTLGTFRSTTYGRVLNVKDQFNSQNLTGSNWASHHNLNQFTKRYSTRNTTYFPATIFTNYTTKNGENLQTVGETAGLHCSDCHLNELNAHGTVSRFFLASGTTDSDVAWNGAVGQATMPCYRCHSSTTYNSSGTTGRFDHARDSNRTLATMTSPLGIICFNCHGGYSNRPEGALGAIHGTNETYNPGNGAVSSKRYRFMSGSVMRFYKPIATGSTYVDPTSWEGPTTQNASCYTVTGNDTWSSGCTSHGNGVNIGTTSINYQKPLNW